jgi:protein-L-isoaspartate(D-aspartate) O-methyltransferase
MYGWTVPPPREPVMTRAQLRQERKEKVAWLIRQGLLRSARIRRAMLKVPREAFIPRLYRDYAYEEVPLPLPGEEATISCPHSYPLFYEPLGLDRAHRFLEVGLGSGYGTALAREIVGRRGQVTGIDIDPETFGFARRNLERAGYRDLTLLCADGGEGCPRLAPFDRICITAACPRIPPPLLEQLAEGGRLIAPHRDQGWQNLILVEKTPQGLREEVICQVLYVSLRGRYR